MIATDFRTTSVGTNEWLRASKKLTIRAYTEAAKSPRSQEPESKTLDEIADVFRRVDETFESSIQTSLDQDIEYLRAPTSSEWSVHATASQKRILRRLFDSGHESVAKRLSNLIDILFEDDDKLAIESMEAVTEFFIANNPKYPGPIIVSDDDGFIGVQWRIPLDQSAVDGGQSSGGILYLKFLSDQQVNYVGTLRSLGSAEALRFNGSASRDEIMNEIEPLKERLDW